jgi:short-subunit dehydrogenase
MHEYPETVLVTGASSGIGLALAELFAADRSRLVLVARSSDKLEEFASRLRQTHNSDVLVIPQDLSLPGAADAVFSQLEQAGWTIDVLVNNAGVGAHGEFHAIPLERHQAMIQLNLTTLVELTHRALPGLVARGRGGILNIGSTAGFQPGPLATIYFATKAFVLSFSEALWYELLPYNVKVTCLCPGPTRTNFGSDYKMTESSGFQWNGMEPLDVARAGHRAFRARRRLVIPGLYNKLLAFLTCIGPRRLILRATAAFNRG